MTYQNEEVTRLIREKHELIRKHDKKEIDEETYNTKLNELDRLLEEQNILTLNKMREEEEKRQTKTEDEKMSKDEVEDTKSIGRKPRENSYTMLIIKNLMRKSIKNIDALVDNVAEEKPGRDKAKIKTQAKTIIGLVKKQKEKRWQQYSWDEKEFLLTEKD